MNNERRKQIADLIERLNEISSEVSTIKENEEEAFENLPESLQCGDQGNKMEEAIDQLESAISYLDDDVTGFLNEAMA